MQSLKRVCAYISTSKIKHNIKEIRKSVSPHVKLMPVIKADGYGHGAVQMARTIAEYADYYAVAIIEEALELRKDGIKKPILILGHLNEGDYMQAFENDISLTISSFEEAELISEAAACTGSVIKLHIAVDTGMGRIGFPPDEASADDVERIAKLKNVCVEGVFTHFSTSDEADGEFTRLQAERFNAFKKMLGERSVNIKLYHASNSAAVMEHKYTELDMVRPGIILYGLYPSEDVKKSALDLLPVMELHSSVAFLKDVKKGDTIGYGRTFTAERTMKIATIPVGYADGYPRLLSNKGRVIINGRYAPIVGRICMDQFMVDVTDIENVSRGDTVVLIGTQGECSVSADELAKHADTINYEIVCNISKRVPREVID